VTSPEKEHGALPKIRRPPHKPLESTFNEGPVEGYVPSSKILSDTEVKTIGLSAVPCASILPPLAIINV